MTARTNPSPSDPPIEVPDHDLLGVIGRGSYGEVWLGRSRLGVLRAVKIVRRAAFTDAGPFAREFKGVQSFEPVSRTHPVLVDILQVGGNEDAFYYIMELADPANLAGGARAWVENPESIALRSSQGVRECNYVPTTLRSQLRERRRLPATEVIELGSALAGGLAHLHAAGLVHRDIKPSNVIFVDGMPKLADIGLVVETGEARSFVGTDGFIPPEGPGTPQADIYSLGKLLYEVSTGKDRMDYPEPVTELGNLVDRRDRLELNAIIHRACQADVRSRYSSAREMERDFIALREGQSIRARHRWVSLFGILAQREAWVFLILLSVLAWSFLGWRRNAAGPAEKRSIPAAARELVREAEKASPTTKAGFEQALELCHRAMSLAPSYAGPHVVLANAYREAAGWHRPERQAMMEARQSARRALELDPENAGAHAQMGLIQMLFEWDFVRAEESFRRSLSLERTNVWHLVAYADLLRSLGRVAEARSLVEEALKLGSAHSPFGSLNHLTDHALQYYAERNFDGMLQEARQMRAARPEGILSYIFGSLAQAGAGRFREALNEIEHARQLEDAPDLMALAAYYHGRCGETEPALTLLRRLDDFAPVMEVSNYFRAYVFAGMGDTNAVFAQLESALAQRSGHLVGYSWRGLLEDAIWDPFQTDSRWTNLVQQVGLQR